MYVGIDCISIPMARGGDASDSRQIAPRGWAAPEALRAGILRAQHDEGKEQGEARRQDARLTWHREAVRFARMGSEGP